MSDVSDLTAIASTFIEDFGPVLDRYHGGMPVGFLAAIAAREGAYTGRPWPMLWGDRSIGEIGYFQVEEAFPRMMGMDPSVRISKEGNIFCGSLEYQVHAVRTFLKYGQLFDLGSKDNWCLARLAFGIGDGGLASVMNSAKPKRGDVIGQLASWAKNTGAYAISPMSAGLVAQRVRDPLVLWNIGMAVKRGLALQPEAIPSPRGVTYRLPKDVAPYMEAGGVFAFAAVATIGLLLL